MAKYRKKPVVIDAFQLPSESNFDLVDFHKWANEVGFKQFIINSIAKAVNGDKGFIIPTLEGKMKARPGDWIIKGVKGEFYPCKSNIFEKTYEKV